MLAELWRKNGKNLKALQERKSEFYLSTQWQKKMRETFRVKEEVEGKHKRRETANKRLCQR